MRARILGAALGLCVAAAFCADAAVDEDFCRNGSFPGTEIHQLGLARVVADGATHFIDDTAPGCPSEAQRCRDRAYLVHGDIVITGRSENGYVCAFFPGRDGGSAGWLRLSDVTKLPVDAAPPLTAWAGRWRSGDDEIRLQVRGQSLEASGSAYWPSANPPRDRFAGGPNVGDMSGVARPQGASVVFGTPDDCRVELALIGGFLIASDNGACGGMNVRFDGLYRRK